MSEAFIKKNSELLGEFDRYTLKHLEILDKIPNGAYVVITIKGDEKFNAQSISMVREPKRKKVVEAHKSGRRWDIRPLRLQAA
jgi:hypothetical protein